MSGFDEYDYEYLRMLQLDEFSRAEHEDYGQADHEVYGLADHEVYGLADHEVYGLADHEDYGLADHEVYGLADHEDYGRAGHGHPSRERDHSSCPTNMLQYFLGWYAGQCQQQGHEHMEPLQGRISAGEHLAKIAEEKLGETRMMQQIARATADMSDALMQQAETEHLHAQTELKAYQKMSQALKNDAFEFRFPSAGGGLQSPSVTLKFLGDKITAFRNELKQMLITVQYIPKLFSDSEVRSEAGDELTRIRDMQDQVRKSIDEMKTNVETTWRHILQDHEASRLERVGGNGASQFARSVVHRLISLDAVMASTAGLLAELTEMKKGLMTRAANLATRRYDFDYNRFSTQFWVHHQAVESLLAMYQS